LFLFQQLEKERRKKERKKEKYCWCRFAKTPTMAKFSGLLIPQNKEKYQNK
jgi:hypothetical protein